MIKLNTKADLFTEVYNFYKKIPNYQEAENMMDAFLDSFSILPEDKLFIKRKLDHYKLTSFNKDSLLNAIRNKIEVNLNLDSENAEKILHHSLNVFKNQVQILQNNQKAQELRNIYDENEAEFQNYISKLSLQINLELQQKKDKINLLKDLIESDFHLNDFISKTNKVLNNTAPSNELQSNNKQLNKLLNNDLNEIIEL
jgi:hypothetical protein